MCRSVVARARRESTAGEIFAVPLARPPHDLHPRATASPPPACRRMTSARARTTLGAGGCRMIGDRDVAFYREHGYLVVPGVLDAAAVETLRCELTAILEGARDVTA